MPNYTITDMIALIIFDMDGLLIDSEPFWRQAEIKVFGEYGIHLSDEDCIKTTGLSVTEVVRFWQDKYSNIPLNINHVAKQILEQVTVLVKKNGVAMAGVYETLNFLKESGIKMALASGSHYSLIHVVLDKLKISDYFSLIQSAENLTYGKPHPDIFISTAKKLKVEPQNCIVFEDSVNGVIAAKAARMKCVAIPEAHNMGKTTYAIADIQLESLIQFDKKVLQQLTN